ncbi:hypothetical protein BDW62DRAFT_176628, partial [Aspergillus aurantiobrunneus]
MSSNSNPINFAKEQTQQAASKVQEGVSSLKPQKSQKDPTEGWSVEEMLETGMDKDGKIVSDPYSYIDGARLSKGQHGNQEADDVAASLDDFEDF